MWGKIRVLASGRKNFRVLVDREEKFRVSGCDEKKFWISGSDEKKIQVSVCDGKIQAWCYTKKYQALLDGAFVASVQHAMYPSLFHQFRIGAPLMHLARHGSHLCEQIDLFGRRQVFCVCWALDTFPTWWETARHFAFANMRTKKKLVTFSLFLM